MLKQTSYRTLAPYAVLAALVALLLVFGLRVPLSRLDVPYTLTGDDIDKVTQVQTVAENGWLFHNDRLGYPFGYDRLDFPRFDSLNYAIMGPIAALTGKPGLALNLYFIAGFFLIAFAAFEVLRRLGIRACPALVGAIVYAFLPYHVIRGVSHVTNGAYFLVPPAFLVLTWVARGELDLRDGATKSRWLFALATAFLLPLQTPYNGFFFAYLCAVGAVIATVQRRRWRAALPALALSAAVAVAFLIELAPVVIHRIGVGEPTLVAARTPAEAEIYSLRLNQVLLPTINHHIGALRQIKRAFDHTMGFDNPYTEVSNQYIGAFGVLGFLALFWTLARNAAARDGPGVQAAIDTESAVRVAALMVAAILLLAMPSGLGTLIAYGITAKVRAYNRILPFLAFPCVLAAAWALQRAVHGIRVVWLRDAALIILGVAATWDIVIRPWGSGMHSPAIAMYDNYTPYFSKVEDRLGQGAAVFQKPVVWYPEQGPVKRMTDYAEFIPYLLTKTLRFSYGGAHGRLGYAWGRYIEKRPPAEMVKGLHDMGFAAILVDGYAYDGDAALHETTDALSHALPSAPTVSEDRRWWLFPLAGCCGESAPKIQDGNAPTVFDLHTDGTPVRFGENGAGWLYMAAGWWDPEDWGVWSSDRRARLRMRVDPVPTGNLILTLNTRMLLGKKVRQRVLTVDGNGRRLGAMTYHLDAEVQSLRFEIPAGTVKNDGILELAFEVTPRTTPYWAGTGMDDRLLGFGLAEMSLAPPDAPTSGE